MKIIPEKYHDLLRDETRALLFLATTMPDGSPQVTPVWFDTEGDYILVNSAAGRVKDRNMRARPAVAMAIADPKEMYRYVQIRGTVVEITSEGAVAHINRLSRKYTGHDYYRPGAPTENRVTYKILPRKANGMG